MYVVTVDFKIVLDQIAAFMPEMRRQARTSLNAEPGCLRFDIVVGEGDPASVLLYEIYQDRDAFEAHLASEHFARFDAAVAPMVEHKSVRSWTLDAGAVK
ncbi:MAG: putative quinol monooxygenase [Pseudomonadota bacterium]